MDFDNRKVYGDTSITDGLVFPVLGNLTYKGLASSFDALLMVVAHGLLYR